MSQHQSAAFRKLPFCQCGEESECLALSPLAAFSPPRGVLWSGRKEAKTHLAAVLQPCWRFPWSTTCSTTRCTPEPHAPRRLHFCHPVQWASVERKHQRAVSSPAPERPMRSGAHVSSRCSSARHNQAQPWEDDVIPQASRRLQDVGLNRGSPFGAGRGLSTQELERQTALQVLQGGLGQQAGGILASTTLP